MKNEWKMVEKLDDSTSPPTQENALEFRWKKNYTEWYKSPYQMNVSGKFHHKFSFK